VRGFEIVAGVIAAFFVIGIVFGVLLVIALPAFRQRRDARGIGRSDQYDRQLGPPNGYGGDGEAGWEEPLRPEDGDGPPRWPGRRG